MGQLMRFLKGFVRIRLESKEPERFLKLCAFHGISLYDVVHKDGVYEMEMDVDSFFRLQPICRKSKAGIHIVKKTGMPFFFMKHKKRKAFFIGIVCCICLLFLCSTRIWNIHIEGNHKYSTDSIMNYLSELQIEHGIPRNRIKCSEVASRLREEFPEMVWVSTKIKGTRLFILIQENVDQRVELKKNFVPSDLIADESGRIVHMIVRKGTPVLKVGDFCQKGDIIIKGEIELLDDNQELIRKDYVAADGDILIQREILYNNSFSRNYKK
ncbi:MAG: sporulation protein YqfD, partial [Lachnospiraceae bacterium]|nr:sporulation protein YqfD [Lachnospiraceae bacterium]